MKISPTLELPLEGLRRLYDLPDYADEATVTAAMHCAPRLDKATATAKFHGRRVAAAATSRVHRAASPLSPPSFDLAMLRSCGDAELRSLLMSALGRTEREAVVGELEHRGFLGRFHPAAARASGYEAPRVDLTSREGAPLKGIGH